MSKSVLYLVMILVVMAAITAVILNVWVPGMKPVERIPRSVAQEMAASQGQTLGQPYGALSMAQAQSVRPALSASPASGEAQAPRVVSLQGTWGRNPFLTLEEIDLLRNPRKYEVEPEPPKVRLSTILTVDGRRTAALNGHYLSVGDFLGTEKVVQISDYGMVLQRENGKTREIRLHDPVIPLAAGKQRN